MTDRTTLRALMDAMKPGPKGLKGSQPLSFDQLLKQRNENRNWAKVYAGRLNEVQATLTNLKPSNTKAQLLEGIEEARAILNGDAK